MSILYPRLISIRRQSVPASFGSTPFGGTDPVQETVVLSGIPANIQYERVGRNSNANLPADSRRSAWMIIIPATHAALGTITENDVVQDDLGKRYQVYAADWQILGYTLHAELLTV